MQVKVCGVTRPEDAALACELGAWAIGMILSKKGPRHVELARAKEIRAALPEDAFAVGVFVDESAKTINQLAAELDLDLVQLHGDEKPELLLEVECPAVKAHFIGKTLPDFSPWRNAWATLLEGAKRGDAFDWELARGLDVPSSRVILAGGLTPENVAKAVSICDPFAVDVSSGVESKPGIKDAAKLRAFFEALA
ncbi:MAG: N-(5'-phosphoribosyl)anthranilate isomerase [Planctomycetota bacterium]